MIFNLFLIVIMFSFVISNFFCCKINYFFIYHFFLSICDFDCDKIILVLKITCYFCT